MRWTLLALVLTTACNSADRNPQRAACGPDDPCDPGAVCVEGMCVAEPPPDTVLVATPPEVTAGATSTFMFTSEGFASGFLCSLDGGARAACSPPFEVTVGEGTHVFEVLALGEGGSDPTPEVFTWTVDLTPPETMLEHKPAALTREPLARWRYAASEEASFLCVLDGADETACTDEMAGLADGVHTLRVRARDRAGHVDPSPAEWIWVIDTRAPVARVERGPSSPTNSLVAGFELACDEAPCSFVYQLDGALEVFAEGSAVELPIGAGAHELLAWAIDAAGNRSAEPARHGWTVDTAKPDTRIDAKPPLRTRQTTASFAFASSKPSSTFRCRLDGGSWVACDAGSIGYSGLGQRTHTFEVYATDESGNADPEPATWSWTVDTTPPALSISSPVAGSTTGRNVALSYSRGDAIDCQIDGGGWTACPASPGTLSYSSSGAKTYSLRVRDDVGNEASAQVTWTVDATGPTVAISSPAAGSTSGKDVTVSYTRGDASECSIDGGSYAACPSPLTRSFSTSGAKTVTIRGRDAYGNEGNTATVTWTVDADAPAVAISSPVAGSTTGKDVTVSYTKGDATQCSVDGGGWGACPSPLTRSYSTSGSKTVSIRGRDAYGNESNLASVTWTVDADPPSLSITYPGEGQILAGPNVTVQMTHSGSSRCWIDGGTFTPCPSSVVRTYAEGAASVRIRAEDPYGNFTEVVRNFRVDNTDPIVDISCPVEVGYNGQIGYSISDFTSVSCTVDMLPVECNSTTYPVRGQMLGERTLRVVARDAAGRTGVDTCTFVLDAGTGHAVLIGHDLEQWSAEAAALLGNAVGLANLERPGVEPIQVLVYTGNPTPGEYPAATPREYRTVIGTILERGGTRVTETSGMRAIQHLRSTHVLVIMDQNGDPFFLNEMVTNPDFQNALGDFYDAGGVIIVLDGMVRDSFEQVSNTWRIVRSAQLFFVGGSVRVPVNYLMNPFTSLGDPVIAGLPATYYAGIHTVRFVEISGATSIVNVSRTYPSTLHASSP